VEVFNEYLLTLKGKKLDEHRISINLRLHVVISAIAISCCKFVEFKKKYNKLLNELIPEFNERVNKLVKDIDEREIIAVRNDLVGHIHSKSKRRPLTAEENIKWIDQMTGGHTKLPEFFSWLRPNDHAKISESYNVCNEIKEIREALESC